VRQLRLPILTMPRWIRLGPPGARYVRRCHAWLPDGLSLREQEIVFHVDMLVSVLFKLCQTVVSNNRADGGINGNGIHLCKAIDSVSVPSILV
jgi:hypothetical protein